ncbi:MAG TPA: MFS transporter [Streptosporangiaceae bacterium]
MTDTTISIPAAQAADPGQASPGGPAHRPLRRNMSFQALWAGSAAASLGVTVADIAYPLAILTVTGSPADAGLFAAVETAGAILAGLPGGHLADRRSPRAILVAAESARALITAGIAVALWLEVLSLPILLAAAVLLGAGRSLVSAARLLLVRAVVPKEQLTAALTQDEVRISGAELAGPPLGGALYGVRVLGHVMPFVFTAVSFALSLVSAAIVRVPDRKAGTASSPGQPGSPGDRSGMLVGIQAIWRNPALRAGMTLLAIVNAVGVSLNLIAVVILRAESVRPAMIGVALAGTAVGGLAGAPLVRPLHKLRPGVLLIVACAFEIPLMALIAVPYGPWWMAGILFAASLGVPAMRVLIDVLILRQAPEEERGRIVGAVLTMLGAGMPAGLAIGGLLLQYLPAQAAMLVMTGLLTVGVLYSAAKPQLWRARWPE